MFKSHSFLINWFKSDSYRVINMYNISKFFFYCQLILFFTFLLLLFCCRIHASIAAKRKTYIVIYQFGQLGFPLGHDQYMVIMPRIWALPLPSDHFMLLRDLPYKYNSQLNLNKIIISVFGHNCSWYITQPLHIRALSFFTLSHLYWPRNWI